MRILFIVPYTPNRIRVRPLELILSLLRRSHELTIATAWTSQSELADLRVLREAGARVVAVRLRPARSAWNCFARVFGSAPLQASFCWQPELARRVTALLAEEPFDIVHVEHLRGARYGLMVKKCLSAAGARSSEFAAAGAPVVWDSVDCIGRLFRQAARASRSPQGRLMARLELKRTERFEARLVGEFDGVLVTSPDDRDSLLNQAARFAGPAVTMEKIEVVPNGVDLNFFKPLACAREAATLIFSGKMSYHANVSAADYLAREILPKIWARRPDVHLMIVGKDPTRQVRALARNGNRRVSSGNGNGDGNGDRHITVTGTVQDIRPFLCRASIAVVPLLYGAGIQNKVLEAMGCGTPVVLSEQARSALTVRPEYEVEVANGSREFSSKILTLLEDPEKRASMSRAGRLYVETQHSWEKAAGKLELFYDRVIRRMNGRSDYSWNRPMRRAQTRIVQVSELL